MGIFGKLKSGITFPFRKAGSGVASIATQGAKMKRWFTSKTLGVAAMFVFTRVFAAAMVDAEVLTLIEQYASWSLPFLMIALRLVTKGPVTK